MHAHDRSCVECRAAHAGRAPTPATSNAAAPARITHSARVTRRPGSPNEPCAAPWCAPWCRMRCAHMACMPAQRVHASAHSARRATRRAALDELALHHDAVHDKEGGHTQAERADVDDVKATQVLRPRRGQLQVFAQDACECVCGRACVVANACRGDCVSWRMRVVANACRGECVSWRMCVVANACRGECVSWLMRVVANACRGVCSWWGAPAAHKWLQGMRTRPPPHTHHTGVHPPAGSCPPAHTATCRRACARNRSGAHKHPHTRARGTHAPATRL
jgi:hypothetical protein